MAFTESDNSQYQFSKNTQAECGITGVLGKNSQDVSASVALYQDRITNRGRDAAGMIGIDPQTGHFSIVKGRGRAKDVFENVQFGPVGFFADRAIGHNRYATSFDDEEKGSDLGIQPIIAEYEGRSIAISYNGNLPDLMRSRLKDKIPSDMDPAPSDIDTYDIARAIISATGETWEEKFQNAMGDIPLAYSLTMLTDDGRLFGLRSPAGTWPLWFTETEDQIILASESRVAPADENVWMSAQPGELIEATPDGVRRTQLLQSLDAFHEQRCALNDLYGARYDSLFMEGVSYYDFRVEVGRKIAELFPVDADIIVGVPESGIAYADGYAEALGKVAIEYIVKKRMVDQAHDDNGSGKSFIAQDHKAMVRMIDGKFDIPNPLLGDISTLKRDKAVLIDDSMIRGNTMGGDAQEGALGVVARMRESGVKDITLILAADKFVEGCDQGYYIRKDQLIAIQTLEDGTTVELTQDEIAAKMGVDKILFFPTEALKDVYEKFTGDRECACMACMGQPHPLEKIARYERDVRPLRLYVDGQLS